MALHNSLAGDAQQLPWASSGWQSHNQQVVEPPQVLSNAVFGSQQPQASGVGVLPVLTQQPSGTQHSVLLPEPTQSSQGLQLPLHVQQWLAVLANNSQQGMPSQPTPRQLATSAQPSAHVPTADAVSAATDLHEDVRQLRAELSDVKSKFAETQACPFCWTPCQTACSSARRMHLSQHQL